MEKDNKNLREWLKKKGYRLMIIKKFQIGILSREKQNSAKPKAVFIGIIWFNKNSIHPGGWIIDFWEEGNFILLCELADEMAKNFKKFVKVQLAVNQEMIVEFAKEFFPSPAEQLKQFYAKSKIIGTKIVYSEDSW